MVIPCRRDAAWLESRGFEFRQVNGWNGTVYVGRRLRALFGCTAIAL